MEREKEPKVEMVRGRKSRVLCKFVVKGEADIVWRHAVCIECAESSRDDVEERKKRKLWPSLIGDGSFLYLVSPTPRLVGSSVMPDERRHPCVR
jgi:hypothetical protein